MTGVVVSFSSMVTVLSGFFIKDLGKTLRLFMLLGGLALVLTYAVLVWFRAGIQCLFLVGLWLLNRPIRSESGTAERARIETK